MDKDNASSDSPQVVASGSPVVGHVVGAPEDAKLEATLPAKVNPAEPVKRRPGRPKGSSKKNLLGVPPPLPKIKRPVGRPRKDGLPAGSVGPERPKVKRNTHAWIAHHPEGYPSVDLFVPGGPLSSHSMAFHIDPNMELDDWAELARNKPDVLLVILLTALAPPNPTPDDSRTAEEAFRSHLISLTHTSQQPQPIPSLYSVLKTFWLPSSPAYFSLTASTSTARTPSEHRFLYWDPHPLVFNGISCPACSEPLTNQGRIASGPVKIYDIEKPFFIIGCEYMCRSASCATTAGPDGRKFASTDPSILRSLPAKLQDEFPARLVYGDTDAGTSPEIWNWKVVGVSNLLWNIVRASLKSGLKKEVVLHLIYLIQHGVSDDGPLLSSGALAGASMANNDAMDDPDAEGVEHDAQSGVDGAASGPATHNFENMYNAGWNGNTAVREPDVGKPSSAVVVPPVQHPPYPLPQHPPFMPYAFYSQPLMGAAGMPNPSAGSISVGPNTEFAPVVNGDSEGVQTKRSPRHCCKCGSKECKGKGGYTFCGNACQDCGKPECRGRNSRRPDKKCSEGWV